MSDLVHHDGLEVERAAADREAALIVERDDRLRVRPVWNGRVGHSDVARLTRLRRRAVRAEVGPGDPDVRTGGPALGEGQGAGPGPGSERAGDCGPGVQ